MEGRAMKVILREDVPSLGKSGDVVTVKNGYGRNFLLPRRLAVEATNKNLKQLEHEKRLINDVRKKKRGKAEKMADALAQYSCTIACQVGEQDKLFGAVTARDIADQMRRDGFEIDRHQVVLEEPLKQLGAYTVPLKLGEGVEASIKVWLVKK
jgi:large subunit ribosomal protein L9